MSESCYTILKDALGAIDDGKARISDARLRSLSTYLMRRRVEFDTKLEFENFVRNKLQEEFDFESVRRAVIRRRDRVTAKDLTRASLQPIEGVGAIEKATATIDGKLAQPSDGLNRDPLAMIAAKRQSLTQVWSTAIGVNKKLAELPSITRDFFSAINSLQKKLPVEKGVSDEAVTVAKAVNALQKHIFSVKKGYDPGLSEIDNFLISRIHSASKIASVEFKEWKFDFIDSFGKKSFKGLEQADIDKALTELHQNIIQGKQGNLMANARDVFKDAPRSGNLVDRLNKHRVFEANDVDAEFRYNQKYGHETVEQYVDTLIEKSSRNTALMDKFGSDPVYTLGKWYNSVVSKSNEADRALLTSEKGVKSIRRSINTVLGAADAPAEGTATKYLLGARKLENGTKLGSVIFRSAPDAALLAGLARGSFNNRTMLENSLSIVGNYARFFVDTASTREALGKMYIFARTANQEIYRDIGPDAVIGKNEKILKMIHGTGDLLTKMTMLSRHTNAMRAAFATVVMSDMADLAGKSFKESPEFFQRTLRRFAIGENEWDFIRQGKRDWGDTLGPDHIGPRDFLDADGIRDIPDLVVENYMRKEGIWTAKKAPPASEITRIREKVVTNYGTMLNYYADLGTSTPGSGQKALLYGGESVNTPRGLATRLLMQFKSASITAAHAHRVIHYSKNGMQGDWTGTGLTAATGMVMWGLGEYAKQGFNGKTPESPLSWSFMGRAAAGSGAMGIWMDTLLSNAERNGVTDIKAGLALAAAGPVIGSAFEAVGLGIQTGKAILGEDTKFPAYDAVRFGRQHFPNHFYSNAAFNYAFFNGMKEWTSHGALRREEKRTREKKGLIDDNQDYWWVRPTDAVRYP